jgi:hypothetical protein
VSALRAQGLRLFEVYHRFRGCDSDSGRRCIPTSVRTLFVLLTRKSFARRKGFSPPRLQDSKSLIPDFLVRDKPTASGRATPTGSAVPASRIVHFVWPEKLNREDQEDLKEDTSRSLRSSWFKSPWFAPLCADPRTHVRLWLDDTFCHHLESICSFSAEARRAARE